MRAFFFWGTDMPFRWPDTSQRALILGSTGSGKSIFGLHMLSKAPITKMPYVIIDYKRDEVINSIPHAKYIDYKSKPKEPGIYILPADPGDEEEVNNFLFRMWAKEKVGLMYDEGFMVPHRPPYKAVNAIYTQGRSKNIPVITLTQRPVEISRFAYSEADFILYMRLNDERDRKTVKNFVPSAGKQKDFWNLEHQQPEYHVKWYDVGKNTSELLLPAPMPDDILQAFDDRLAVKRKVHL